VPVGVPLAWHEATEALPALSVLAPTFSVAAKPYTAPKIVSARTMERTVRFFATALMMFMSIAPLVCTGRTRCPLCDQRIDARAMNPRPVGVCGAYDLLAPPKGERQERMTASMPITSPLEAPGATP